MSMYVLLCLAIAMSSLISNLARRSISIKHPPEILKKVEYVRPHRNDRENWETALHVPGYILTFPTNQCSYCGIYLREVICTISIYMSSGQVEINRFMLEDIFFICLTSNLFLNDKCNLHMRSQGRLWASPCIAIKYLLSIFLSVHYASSTHCLFMWVVYLYIIVCKYYIL